jgi:hypothetical protein
VAYAGYFAMSATEGGANWGIIEVDTDLLDPIQMMPDEDYLEQASRNQEIPEWEDDEVNPVGDDIGDPYYELRLANKQPPEGRMKARTEYYRNNIWGYSQYWKASVEGLGNCCHVGDIPMEAITRITIFEPKSNPEMHMSVDPCITLQNYMICGGKYKSITRWLAGYEDVNGEDICLFFIQDQKHTMPKAEVEELPKELQEQFKTDEDFKMNAKEYWDRIVIPNRSGLEIVMRDGLEVITK